MDKVVLFQKNSSLDNYLRSKHLLYLKRLALSGEWRKLGNVFRAACERRGGKITVSSMPYYFEVEATTACQLKCPLCPTGTGAGPSPMFLDIGLYKKFISEIGPYAVYMQFYRLGEPLLHPDICKMVSMAAAHGVRTYISSNMNTMPSGGAEAIVDSGLGVLKAGIDGASQASYSKMRAGGNFERAYENLRAVVAARKAAGRGPHIIWLYVVNRHNEGDMAQAEKLAADAGVDAIVFMPVCIPGNIPDARDWEPEDRNFIFQGNSADPDCYCPWGNLNVGADGLFYPCRLDSAQTVPFGNLASQTVREVWNGPRYLAARTMLSGGQKDSGVCASCAECTQRGRANFKIY